MEKNSLSAPMIFEDMDVLAQLMSASLPRASTSTDKCSSIYLQACAGGAQVCGRAPFHQLPQATGMCVGWRGCDRVGGGEGGGGGTSRMAKR